MTRVLLAVEPETCDWRSVMVPEPGYGIYSPCRAVRDGTAVQDEQELGTLKAPAQRWLKTGSSRFTSGCPLGPVPRLLILEGLVSCDVRAYLVPRTRLTAHLSQCEPPPGVAMTRALTTIAICVRLAPPRRN